MPSCTRVNLLSDAVKATMSITAHPAARRESLINSNRILTIADLYQLDAVGNLLLQQRTHARRRIRSSLCTERQIYGDTRSTTRVYVSLRRAKVRCMDRKMQRIAGSRGWRRVAKGGIFPLWNSANGRVLWNLMYWSCLISHMFYRVPPNSSTAIISHGAVPDVRNPSLKSSRCISN